MLSDIYKGSGSNLDVSAKFTAAFGMSIANGKLFLCDNLNFSTSYTWDIDTGATLIPAGVGNIEYDASGVIRIGDELMEFTRSGDVLIFTSRGYLSSSDAPLLGSGHNAGDLVQQCKVFTGVRVEAIIEDLLENFATIPSAFIDTATWAAEAAVYLATMIFSTIISEPVGVSTLVSELCEQASVLVYWHEEDAEFKFQALRQSIVELAVDDSMMVQGSFTQVDQPGLRVSRVTIRYTRTNPVLRLDDPLSFSKSVVSIDTDAETSTAFGDIRHLNINSRWLGENDATIAVTSAAAILARYVHVPVLIRFTLDPKDVSIWTGSVITIEGRFIQSVLGGVGMLTAQIIEARETEEGLYEFSAVTLNVIIPTPLPTEGWGTDGFWSPWGLN